MLLRLSSALPDSIFCFSSLGSGPQHDATVSLGHRVLRLWPLVHRRRRLLSKTFRPTLSPLHWFPDSLSPPLSSLFSPSSLSSCLFPSSFRPRPRPCFRHHYCFLPPVPGTVFSPPYHIVGQAPGLAPEAANYLEVPLPVYIT